VPVELVAKLTDPVGVVAVPSEVSFTVAVQLVCWFTTRDEGVQVRLVAVGALGVIPKLKLSELPEWPESPAYAALRR
jgi:hypothetical protein